MTANTRADARDLLRIAAEIPIEVTAHPYPLRDAERALADLAGGRMEGEGLEKEADPGPEARLYLEAVAGRG